MLSLSSPSSRPGKQRIFHLEMRIDLRRACPPTLSRRVGVKRPDLIAAKTVAVVKSAFHCCGSARDRWTRFLPRCSRPLPRRERKRNRPDREGRPESRCENDRPSTPRGRWATQATAFPYDRQRHQTLSFSPGDLVATNVVRRHLQYGSAPDAWVPATHLLWSPANGGQRVCPQRHGLAWRPGSSTSAGHRHSLPILFPRDPE